MHKNLLLNDLAKLLSENIDNLNDNYNLQSNALWDSLTLVSAIALIDQHYHVAVKGSDIEPCRTIGELLNTILVRKSKLTTNSCSLAGV